MASASTLVLGGNGRLAAALRRYLPEETRYAARVAGDARCVAIGDYAAASPAIFDGIKTVINCAGIVAGSARALRQANVDAPTRLALAARTAGVRRMVQVSSFSVLGHATFVNGSIPPGPVSEYGRSKLAAEEELLALADDRFAVTAVRLPAIVGAGGRDKLRRLVRFWLRIRRLPVPRSPVQRAMISVDLAAHVLADIARGDERGILHAADPAPFTYADAAAAIAAATGRAVGLVTLPDAAIRSLRRGAPALYASLYGSSVLAAADNRAGRLPSDLYQVIADLAQQEIAA